MQVIDKFLFNICEPLSTQLQLFQPYSVILVELGAHSLYPGFKFLKHFQTQSEK